MNLASAPASQFARRHPEMLAALANEMGRVGQSDPEPDAADAQAVKPRVGHHSVRGCHPALIQNPAKGQACAVHASVQGSLGDAEVRAATIAAVRPGS